MQPLLRPSLHPATALTRNAVYQSLTRYADGSPEQFGTVFVGLSGGADSLALLAATAFVTQRLGVNCAAIIVDHGLQPDSEQVAVRAAEQARDLLVRDVRTVRVTVTERGEGLEAAARAARFAVFSEQLGDNDVLLLGHNQNDQAEQVLLGLARGSGLRAIAGIAPARGQILRPFLDLDRQTIETACAAQQLQPWRDPHNEDERFLRVRVRRRVLPFLEEQLGPGVAHSLVRTAQQARDDADYFAQLVPPLVDAAEIVATEADPLPPEVNYCLDVSSIEGHPAALLKRIVREAARRSAGVSLSANHTEQVVRLIHHWRGQKQLELEGVRVQRAANRLFFKPGAIT